MYKTASLLVLAAVLIGVYQAESTAAVQRRARPGSFVYYTAPSVDSLVSQVNSNPTVAKRYANHYGTSADSIAKYFKSHLKTIALSKPTTVTTYFVSKNGTIQSKKRLLPAGALVFATEDGEVLLEARCGNPLTKRLPAPKPVTKVKASTETVQAPPVEETLIPPAVEALPEALEIAEPLTAMAIPVEPLLAPSEAILPSILDLARVAVPALLGAVAVTSSDTPPVVPEPNCLAATAMASLVVVTGWRRRNSGRPRP